MTYVLFVCSANQCRSPMAAALAERAFDERNLDVHVRSAGLTVGGFPSTEDAQIVMAERGLDISKHESAFIGDALDPSPDLILVMEPGHLRKTGRIDPAIAGKAFTLKGFVWMAETVGSRKNGETIDDYLARVSEQSRKTQREDMIRDPIGLGPPEYQRCADELEELIQRLADLVWPDNPRAKRGDFYIR